MSLGRYMESRCFTEILRCRKRDVDIGDDGMDPIIGVFGMFDSDLKKPLFYLYLYLCGGKTRSTRDEILRAQPQPPFFF